MVLTYKQCIDKYGSNYQLKKELDKGKLFFKEKGIYTSDAVCSEMEIITVKYPQAVYTGKSAFYYHSLTDVIPDYYYLATVRNGNRIKDSRVQQTYLKKEIFDMGKIKMQYHNIEINIYSPERMLIELMRFRNKMPLDYYKEIILNYRKRADYMDFGKVEEYADKFRNAERLMDMIQLEVL